MQPTSFDSYSIIEQLNRGGMAQIYLVAAPSGQRYIVRALLPEYRFNWRWIRRFHWGCRVHRQLDHPNIIRFIEERKSAGRRYAVLEYVDGDNLKEKILRSDPLLRSHQLRLLLGMASALAHVHERGFLHLDFKPENILVSREYDPKLIDFDLAIRRPARPRRASRLSGTPSYLAPEQIYRLPVDERADIFAFGVTAYEMLSGKKPVTGNTLKEMLEKYADFDLHLKPLRTHVPNVPYAIERVILKCLEKNVERRYPSMGLVVRDLET
jgi:serine/threonine protein kinase